MATGGFNSSRPKRSRTSRYFEEADIEVELDAMKAENAKLKQMIKTRDAKIDKQAVLIDDLKNKRANEDMEEEMEILKDNEAKLDAKLVQVQAESEKERNRLEAKMAAINVKAVEARRKIALRDNEIKELKEQLSAMQDVKARFKNDEDKALGSKIGLLKNQVEFLTKNNALLEEKAENAATEFAEKFQAMAAEQLRVVEENNECKKKIDALEEQLKALKEEADHRCNELKQKEDEASTVIADQQKKIQVLEDQLRQAKIFLDNATQDSADALGNPPSTSQTNQSADSVVQDLKAELEKAKAASEIKTLSVNEIHDGSEILFDRLGNRVVVNVKNLEADRSTFWKFYASETSKPLKLDVAKVFKKTRFEINLTGQFVSNLRENDRKIQEIIHRINESSLIDLTLEHQKLDSFDFKKLINADTVKIVKFRENTIWKSNGKFMEFDEILKHLTNVEHFYYFFKTYNEVNVHTAKNLSKLPRFEKLKHFELFNCAYSFDLSHFQEFMNKHKNVCFILHFRSYGPTIQNNIQRMAERLIVPETCKFYWFF